MDTKRAIFITLFGMLLAPAAAQDWPLQEPDLVPADGFRQTTWAEFLWRDDAWTPSRRQLLAYDDEGRLAQVTHQSMFSDDWRTSRQETYAYDEASRRTETLIQETVGRNLQNRGRHTYRYDEGQLAEEVIESWSYEQKWMPLFRHTLQYDEAGRLVQHDVQALHKEVAFGAEHMENTYDEAGHVVQQVRYREQEGAWVEAEKRTYRYDGDRLVELSTSFLSKGGPAWTEALRLIYHYEDDRLTAIVAQHRGPTDGLEDALRRAIAYDDAGNPVEVLFSRWQDGEWREARKETYGYETVPE